MGVLPGLLPIFLSFRSSASFPLPLQLPKNRDKTGQSCPASLPQEVKNRAVFDRALFATHRASTCSHRVVTDVQVCARCSQVQHGALPGPGYTTLLYTTRVYHPPPAPSCTPSPHAAEVAPLDRVTHGKEEDYPGQSYPARKRKTTLGRVIPRIATLGLPDLVTDSRSSWNKSDIPARSPEESPRESTKVSKSSRKGAKVTIPR